MSVNVQYFATVDTDETIAANSAAVSDSSSVELTGYSDSLNINENTTITATKAAYFEVPLVAGAATIDLTSLEGINGASVDFTGLKVRIAKFRNKAGNVDDITVSVGASNGYELAGSGFEETLSAGQHAQHYLADSAPTVGASDKTIDVSGTGVEVLEVALIAG